MEEHVLTLLVDITARVHRGLRENTVTKVGYIYMASNSKIEKKTFSFSFD